MYKRRKACRDVDGTRTLNMIDVTDPQLPGFTEGDGRFGGLCGRTARRRGVPLRTAAVSSTFYHQSPHLCLTTFYFLLRIRCEPKWRCNIRLSISFPASLTACLVTHRVVTLYDHPIETSEELRGLQNDPDDMMSLKGDDDCNVSV
jgi:hypothetical protein